MKYGEIVQLGRHRLMCGDATNRDDVMKLIDGAKIDLGLTDPPYGVRSVDIKRGKLEAAHKYTHRLSETQIRTWPKRIIKSYGE